MFVTLVALRKVVTEDKKIKIVVRVIAAQNRHLGCLDKLEVETTRLLHLVKVERINPAMIDHLKVVMTNLNLDHHKVVNHHKVVDHHKVVEDHPFMTNLEDRNQAVVVVAVDHIGVVVHSQALNLLLNQLQILVLNQDMDLLLIRNLPQDMVLEDKPQVRHLVVNLVMDQLVDQ